MGICIRYSEKLQDPSFSSLLAAAGDAYISALIKKQLRSAKRCDVR
jgi:hypothetical protein